MYVTGFICCSRLICNSTVFPHTPLSTLLFPSQPTLSLSPFNPLLLLPSYSTVCLLIYLHSNPQTLPPSHRIPSSIPSPHLPLSHPLPLPCQVCSESPSKDLSTKLHNMSAMFGLYYKRDGRYNKGSEMWASGLCRYLHDAYPDLTMQVLKLFTEVCMAPAMCGWGYSLGMASMSMQFFCNA